MHVRLLDTRIVEDRLEVIGPEIHVVVLLGAIGVAVATQVHLDDLEGRVHQMGDEAEVLVGEARAADLEQVLIAVAVDVVFQSHVHCFERMYPVRDGVVVGGYEGMRTPLFLLQGGLLALGGAAAGSLVGAGALVLWQRYVRNADGTAMFPLVLDPTLFALALMIATLTGLLAAVAPALRAARLDPVVAIRG